MITALAITRNHGIVPVKKKSKTLPPELEKPKPDTVTQLKNPKMKIPMPPPIMSQSDVLNLLKSMVNPLRNRGCAVLPERHRSPGVDTDRAPHW